MKNIGCPICGKALSVRFARGRTSNKAFIMLKCDHDGRHFRGFITDQTYVNGVLQEREAKAASIQGTGTEGRDS
jgi:hypothetical protein